MVEQAQAVVAPDEGCAASAAACGHARTAFAGFGGLAGFGGEPVLLGGSCGEGSEGGRQEGLEGNSEAWEVLETGDDVFDV